MEFIELGFGEEEKIIKKLDHTKTYVLICDSDAANVGACPWYAVESDDQKTVEDEYSERGGSLCLSMGVKKGEVI